MAFGYTLCIISDEKEYIPNATQIISSIKILDNHGIINTTRVTRETIINQLLQVGINASEIQDYIIELPIKPALPNQLMNESLDDFEEYTSKYPTGWLIESPVGLSDSMAGIPWNSHFQLFSISLGNPSLDSREIGLVGEYFMKKYQIMMKELEITLETKLRVEIDWED